MEEYHWSCTLTGTNKEFLWNPEDPTNSKEEQEDEAVCSEKSKHR